MAPNSSSISALEAKENSIYSATDAGVAKAGLTAMFHRQRRTSQTSKSCRVQLVGH
jgi:hypothetical protein